MNILHINTADNLGGAAKAAYRLHLGLRQRKHTSRMLVSTKTEKDDQIDVFPRREYYIQKLRHRAVNFVERKSGLQYLLNVRREEFFSHLFVNEAAIINLHNIHGGFFSYRLLPKLTSLKPVVWTLHDPWSMTGHCGYPQVFGCERWRTGCGNCPALEDYPEISIDTTAFLWNVKKRTYKNSKLVIVAPSKWLMEMARTSPLLVHFSVHHIPYGLDTSFYKPISKKEARAVLGLPQDKKIILFTAFDITSPRKGISYLLEAIRRKSKHMKDCLLITLGQGQLKQEELNGIPAYHPLGYSSDDERMVSVYNSADIFVIPTLADNLPNTVLESLACGTPVVAFNVGGIPDIVHNQETGYIAQLKNTDDLANGINEILADDNLRQRMGRKGRETMEENHTLSVQAKRYESLYQELLSSR